MAVQLMHFLQRSILRSGWMVAFSLSLLNAYAQTDDCNFAGVNTTDVQITPAAISALCESDGAIMLPDMSITEVTGGERAINGDNTASLALLLELPNGLAFKRTAHSVSVSTTGAVYWESTNVQSNAIFISLSGASPTQIDAISISGIEVMHVDAVPGDYDITVSTFAGCVNGIKADGSTLAGSVTVLPTPDQPTISFTAGSQFCLGEQIPDGFVTVTSVHSLRYFSDAATSTEISAIADNSQPTASELGFNTLTSGTQTVYVIAESSQGCRSAAKALAIDVVEDPTLDVSSILGEICPGELVQIDLRNYSNGTVSWTNNNAAIGLASSGGDFIYFTAATNSTADPIDAIVEVTAILNGCAVKEQINFSLLPGPAIEAFSPAVEICNFSDEIDLSQDPRFAISLSNAGDVSLGSFSYSGKGITNSSGIFNASSESWVDNELVDIDVTYTRQNGCATTRRLTLMKVISNPTVSISSPLADADACRLAPIELTIETNNQTSGVSWQTTGTGTFSGTFNSASSQNTFYYTPAETDAASITLTVSTNNPGAPCTIDTDQVSLQLYEPIVEQVSDIELCPGTEVASIPFTSSSMPGEGNFSWEVGDKDLLGLASPTGTGDLRGITAAPNFSGSKLSTTVTVYQTVAGCTSEPMYFDIIVKPEPVVADIANISLCPGEAVALSISSSPVNAATTYAWSADNTAVGIAAEGTSANISFHGAANNTGLPITATVTYSAALNGCVSAEKTFVITLKPTPDVIQPADVEVCSGELVSRAFASSLDGVDFSWSIVDPVLGMSADGIGDLSFTSLAHYGTGSITRTVKVIATKDNCSSEELSFDIILKPLPKITAKETLVVFPGQQVAEIPFSDNSGGLSTFTWSANNDLVGLASTSGTGPIPAFEAKPNTTGANIVTTITVSSKWNDCNSDVSMQFDIKLLPQPVMTAVDPVSECPGTAVSLVFASDIDGSTYSWTNDNTAIGLGATGVGNISFTATNSSSSQPAEATIKVIPKSPDGVEGDAVVIAVSIKPVPVIDPQIDIELCPGDARAISFTSSMTAAEGFSWEVGDKDLLGLASFTGTGDLSGITAAPNFSGSKLSTTVTVYQTVAGCVSEPMHFDIIVKPEPVVADIANISLCPGEAVALSISSSPVNAATTYAWSADNTDVGIAAEGSSADISFHGAANNTGLPITATVTYSAKLNGCVSAEKTFVITLKPTPDVILPADVEVCSGKLVSRAFASSLDGVDFSWSIVDPVLGMSADGIGDLSFTSLAHYGTESITRTVKVIATKDNCSSEELSFDIILKPLPKITAKETLVVFPGQQVAEIPFSDNSGGLSTFTWSANNDLVGIASTGGEGPIPTFEAKPNTTGESIVTTITVSSEWNDCSSDASMQFDIEISPQPLITAVEDVTECAGELVEVIFESNVSGTTFNWTNDNTAIGLTSSGSGNLSFTATEANITSEEVALIEVTPVSSEGVAGDPTDFFITIKPVSVVDAQTHLELCPGDEQATINFTSNMTHDGDFSWEVGNKDLLGLTSNTGTGSLSGITAAANTTGSNLKTTVTVTQLVGTCISKPMTFDIVVKPQPVLTTVSDQAVCPGEAVAINFAANTDADLTSYSWESSNPALGLAASGKGDISFTAPDNFSTEDIASTITYTAAINSCVSEEKSFVIRVRPEPVMDQHADIIICSGDLARSVFGASLPDVSYSWTIQDPVLGMPVSGTGTGNLNFATEAHFGESNVERIVKVKASKNGCVSEEKEFNLILKPKPLLVQQTDLVIFPGDNIAELIFADNSQEASTISWTASNASLIGLASNSGTGSIPAFVANDNTSGGTIESTIIVDAVWNGCENASMEFSIQLRPRPIIEAVADLVVCPGDPVEVNFESNVSGTTFNWTNDNTATGLEAENTGHISFTAAENFSGLAIESLVSVTPVSPSGFEGEPVEFLIRVKPVPVIEPIQNLELCPGEELSIDFLANTDLTSFYWGNDNTLIGLGESGDGDFLFTGAENFSGSNIIATITYFASREGCESEAQSFTITLKNQPVADALAAAELCSGQSFTPPAFSDDTDAASTFFWSIDKPELLGLETASGEGNLPVLQGEDNFTGTAKLITVTYYSVLNSCTSESLTYELSLLPSPVLENTDVYACANDPISILLQANTDGGESYTWENDNPGIGLSATEGDGDLIEFEAINTSEVDQLATITVSIHKDGCTFPSQTFDIIVKPLPELNNPAADLVQELCSGEEIVFDPVSNLDKVHFEWTASSDIELENFTTSGQGPIRETVLNGNNTTATITYSISPIREDYLICVGPITELVIYLAPIPSLSLPQVEYEVCNGEMLNIMPGSETDIVGTYYEWEVTANASGAISGSGSNVEQELFNETNEAETITYTINAIAGDCRSELQTVTVFVSPFATVSAGEDFVVCEEDPIVVEGTVGGSATHGSWSGGLGVFQNVAASVTTYEPDPSEIGTSIELFYTTNDPSGPCSFAVDTVNISIEPLPDLAIVNLPGVYCTQNEPFLLEAFPANGTFSGDGVVFNEEEEKYYFDPKISGIGLYRVSYAYQSSNGCTGTSSGLIDVSSGANPDFSILSESDNICEIQSRIGLSPLVQGGVFEGPGVEISAGKAWFNPSEAVIGENLITHSIIDPTSGCTTSSSQTIFVNAQPEINIEYENICIDNKVQFSFAVEAISDGDEILSYNWSFGDGFSSSDAAPIRQYSSPGVYEVSLRIETALACEVTVIEQDVVVSNIVSPSFSFENICGNDTTIFIPEDIETILNYSNANFVNLEYFWNFGDPASGEANTATEANARHRFSGFGEFEVSLRLRSNQGCEQTISQKINIVPAITSFPHNQQFKGSAASTGWFAEGSNNSWQYGIPAGNVINNPAVPGTNVWATGLSNSESYANNERSYVISPCFDLSSIEQPMISMNMFWHAETGRDGAVLQYSKDGGRSWSTLGKASQGLNWYNSSNIVADPSEQGIGNEGWSGISDGWREVAYTLDKLKEEASSVMFRISFASDASNVGDLMFEGIALDDVYVGSRNKKVLVENFTNVHASGFIDNIYNFADLQSHTEVGNDVVLLQYHTAFPRHDTVYLRNPQDQGARALFYGIHQAPQIVIDGVKYDSFDRTAIGRQSLSKPGADINIQLDGLSESHLLKGTLDLNPIGSLEKELILYIVAVEVEAGTEDIVLRNVSMKILPEPHGIYLNELKSEEQFNFEWDVSKDFAAGNLGVLAYLQEKDSKKVLQSSFVSVATSMEGGQLTALGDINAELKNIEVYPNPANDFIHLQTSRIFGKDLEYELIHLDGTVLSKGRLKAGEKEYKIECRDLPNGIYILRVFTDQSNPTSFKVMVLHSK